MEEKALPIERIEGKIDSGSAHTFVVSAEDGRRYVVKPLHTGMGIKAAAFDLLLSAVAGRTGILTPRKSLLILDHVRYEGAGLTDEDTDILSHMKGIPLPASQFIEDAVDVLGPPAGDISGEYLLRLYLFDLFFLNFDRKAANSNLMSAGSQTDSPTAELRNTGTAYRLYSIDYGCSLLLEAAWEGFQPDIPPLLPLFAESPLRTAAKAACREELVEVFKSDLREAAGDPAPEGLYAVLEDEEKIAVLRQAVGEAASNFTLFDFTVKELLWTEDTENRYKRG